MEDQQVLQQSLEVLGLSHRFVVTSKEMGCRTMAEIIECGLPALQQKKEFDYHWLAELSEYLSDKGLLHLLQPLPGSKKV
ncbi:hypothetical protein [Mucilaginibacter sp. 3215]|uniref:hypothetical protein n=1 Tax=Mucilaginibacter sp. 3215 TaxID=3373912 RepID=UPI003D1BEF8A